jgi:septum formation protein
MKLYLASQSPRRQELLQLITSDFTVVESDFDEKEVAFCLPESYVQKLARGKARHAKLPDAVFPVDAAVIGCDTIVVSPEGRIFGKPESRMDAFAMLMELSGRTHSVITGVCLRTADRENTFAVTTKVTFYPLTPKEIERYLACGEYADKAGAYGIQGKGSLLCQTINGDYFNIVGLPVSRLARELEKAEILL